MKKVLFAIFTIITLGLFLIPISHASSFSASQLDNTNRLTNIYKTNEGYTRLVANMSGLSDTTSYFACLQIFSKEDLNKSVALFGTSSTVSNNKLRWYKSDTANDWYVASYYSSSSNLGYRSNNSFTGNNTIFFEIRDNTYNLDNYVFNLVISKSYTSGGFIGSFIPNTYYNVGGLNNRGFYQYFKTELRLLTNKTDISDTAIGYNYIDLGSYKNQVYLNNNTDTYQYFLRVYFNSMSITDFTNMSVAYLEISDARIGGVYYSTYSALRSAKPYISSNITLYNNTATLFTGEAQKVGYEADTIDYITFRLPDYAFKSSSYFNSNVGLDGYIENAHLSMLNPTNEQSYNEGLEIGYNSGYKQGKIDGFNEGQGSQNNSFSNMMLAVADAPIRIISSLLNFEILGVNLMSFFMGLITLMLFIFILRKFKE